MSEIRQLVHHVEVITKDTGRSLDVISQSLTHTCASGDLCPFVRCENVRPWVSGAAVNVAAVFTRLKYTERWFRDRTHRAMMRAAMFLNPLPQCTRLPLRMRNTLSSRNIKNSFSNYLKIYKCKFLSKKYNFSLITHTILYIQIIFYINYISMQFRTLRASTIKAVMTFSFCVLFMLRWYWHLFKKKKIKEKII